MARLIFVILLVKVNLIKSDVRDLLRGYYPDLLTNQELPEIIVNKNAAMNNEDKFSGYHYEKPDHNYVPPPPPVVPPQQSDEPIYINNDYLPPTQPDEILPTNEYLPPGNEYLPSNDNEVLINFKKPRNNSITLGYEYPTPNPPFSDENQNGYFYNPPPKSRQLPISQVQTTLRLELTELRCVQNLFFKAIITVKSFLEILPVIDIDSPDTRCKISASRSQLSLSIPVTEFDRCGVVKCGNANDLCLRIRFPHIRDMKTHNDELLTLQCRVQEKVKERVHTIKMGGSDLSQKRSSGIHANGGSQNLMRTDVALYRRIGRRSGGDTYTKLEAGGIVQLGEEMILRAQMNPNDGWNHSRMVDVQLQRSGVSVPLVLSTGCVNPAMKTICPNSPIFDPPLGHRFSFKAIMFQGMKSGDEMSMTVRLIGCVEREDCAVDYQSCLEKNSSTTRWKRSVGENNSEISKIFFRIVIPGIRNDLPSSGGQDAKLHQPISVIIGAGVACLITLIALICVAIKLRRMNNKNDCN